VLGGQKCATGESRCGRRGVIWREREINFSCTADASGPPCFSLCPASPERPLCSEDRLGAPDTVSSRDGQKDALGEAAGNIFLEIL
jgi:hypothetical protein